MPSEKTFHREIIDDLAHDHVTLKKIPDSPVSYTQKDDGSKVRFSPSRFVDLVGVGPDRCALFWEAKMMTGLNSFPLSRIEPNQLRDLLELADRASALFIINYRVKKYATSTLKKLGLEDKVDHKRINLLTSCFPHDILNAIERGDKSIPIKELSRSFVQRPWGGRWTYAGVFQSVWRP